MEDAVVPMVWARGATSRVGATAAMLLVPLALAPAVALALPTGPVKFPTSPIRASESAHTGTLVSAGRQVVVSGPLQCWKSGTVQLRATISERSTQTLRGAIAQGSWRGTCTGALQHWHLTITAGQGTTLRAGCAQADGLLVYRHYGQTVDVKQWLQTITIFTPGTTSYAGSC
jgi:hypothetical protein